MTASTSYNRLDPVDIGTFRSYVRRYRRISKLYGSPTGSRTPTIEPSNAIWHLCLCHQLARMQTCPPMQRPSSSSVQLTQESEVLVAEQEEKNSSRQSKEGFSKYLKAQSNKKKNRRTSLTPSAMSDSSSSSSSSFKKSAKFLFLKSRVREGRIEENQKVLSTQVKQGYKESVTRLHLERLMVGVVFWEAVLSDLVCLHLWTRPEVTAIAAMCYSYLWFHNMLPAAFCLYISYYLLNYRYNPSSFDVMRSRVKSRMLEVLDSESMLGRMRRGTRLDLLYLHKRFAETYGESAQTIAQELADINERGENLILWRDPKASWCAVVFWLFVSFACLYTSPATIWKSILSLLGLSFFLLQPALRIAKQKYLVEPSTSWLLFGAPTHAEYAVQLDEQ